MCLRSTDEFPNEARQPWKVHLKGASPTIRKSGHYLDITALHTSSILNFT